MKLDKFILIIIGILFLFPDASAIAGNKKKRYKKEKYKKGEILVRYKAAVQHKSLKLSARKAEKYSKIKSFRKLGIDHLKLSKDISVEQAIEQLKNDPTIEFAEPNYVYGINAIPNDEHFYRLWGLHNTGQEIGSNNGTPDADMDAPEAWDIASNAEDVIVAVVDSGIDYNHPDLAANIWVNNNEIPDNGIDDDGNGFVDDVKGWNFVTNTNDPLDTFGHGTHVSGIIGAVGNNGIGITGVAWDVKLMAAKGLGSNGYGYTSDLIAAIEYAVDNGADIINISWGGEDYSRALKDTIENSQALFVCAAGNNSVDIGVSFKFPAALDCPNIISVAATDSNDELAEFSNYSNIGVDVGAPGVDIYSTLPTRKIIFADNFNDRSLDGWRIGGKKEAWGITDINAISPPYSLADSPYSYSEPGTDSWIRSSRFNFFTEKHIILDFVYAGHLTSGDYFAVETSTDNSTWTEIFRADSISEYWEQISLDLKHLEGNSRAWLRMRMVSESSDSDGCYIDDVKLSSFSDAYDGSEYGYKSGTSMAAPHVSGIAALVKSIQPGFDCFEIKNAVEDSVDPEPSLDGKTVTGGRVNISNVIESIVPISFSHESGFQIHTDITGFGSDSMPKVAFVSNGYSMAIWSGEGIEGIQGVYGQIFDPTGDKSGGEFRINPLTNDYSKPEISGLANNTFIITGQTGPSSIIYGQIINFSGEKIGSEIMIADVSGYPKSTNLKDGGFVVTYTHGARGPLFKIFNNLGSLIKEETALDNVYKPEFAIDSLKDGGYVITWPGFSEDSTRNIVYAQIFDDLGNTVKDKFVIASELIDRDNRSSFIPKVTGLSNGGFSIVWQNENDDNPRLFFRLFTKTGDAVGGEYQIFPPTLNHLDIESTTSSPLGVFLVSWSAMGNPNGVMYQIFYNNGDPATNPVAVNSNPDISSYYSDVAGSTANQFFIAWRTYNRPFTAMNGRIINLIDSDNDGMVDSIDNMDTDGDGLPDRIEDKNDNGILDDGETDPADADTDGDGLSDGLEDENKNGRWDKGETDLLDADSDDDGILDGWEDANQNGIVDADETDPLNVDTDGDGIQDGTELGFTLENIGSDTDIDIFVPDEDSSTTTDPLISDTDGDGYEDGSEDKNNNGRIDEGEFDPNDVESSPRKNIMPIINLLLLSE